ncbi:hypothetical protein K9U39_07635 [Rhodoblastus acidophilus]|uniref:Uncharacterized protein n=1 Tax=Candidatus Rhodoblastus alkanivorans TaxID=2954117 RepID=A0ABS9Z7B7_9HYPH|nr:hypothetical protein [Candidatus Rhodoblastus alkanivorans]MCI4678703.1 hypothetical protein [Candidatus Rhodoblastus alkanivorans]MCI4683501.1 hypothetical protein [Candidatus Rhodoblastus alkanivorans]MDI4640816.1 hypothetical protein [Rhodoblastus acidophilus]
MRTSRNFVLAGAVALALAGGAGLALAQSMHVMTVPLPDGGLARIEYSGNIPPRVAFAPEPVAFGYAPPDAAFAAFDRISAQMDRDMILRLDALMSDMAMPAPIVAPDRMINVGLDNLPPGAMQYSYVSTMGDNGGYCMRSMEMVQDAPGARPHVVTHMSGDCRGVGVRFNGPAFVQPRNSAPRIDGQPWQGGHRAGPELLNVNYQPTR